MERWRPRTEQDILSAIEGRTLEENHYLEVKRELNWSDGAKKELARDLAQFAVDGGHIIVGLTEDKPNKTWLPTPIPDPAVKDIRERIEQIATMKIDPPLPVTVALIPAGTSGLDPELSGAPASGHYLVIEVPPSAVAPHMVDGRYYSRGDTMKSTLSDAEVLRLHSSRRDEKTVIEELLDAEIERRPFKGESLIGQMFLVAHPVLGTAEMAAEYVHAEWRPLFGLVHLASQEIPSDIRGYQPAMSIATGTSARSGGVACHSPAIDPGRTVRSHDDLRQAVDIEFGEDGSLRLFAGRVTGHVDSAQRSAIYDDLVAAYAIGLVALAREFADQIGYRGPWQFGIAVTGLKSLSATAWSAFGGSGPVYDRDDYRRTAGATRPQIDKPYVVAGALIRPLLRSLGTVRHTGRFLEPTDS